MTDTPDTVYNRIYNETHAARLVALHIPNNVFEYINYIQVHNNAFFLSKASGAPRTVTPTLFSEQLCKYCPVAAERKQNSRVTLPSGVPHSHGYGAAVTPLFRYKGSRCSGTRSQLLVAGLVCNSAALTGHRCPPHDSVVSVAPCVTTM